MTGFLVDNQRSHPAVRFDCPDRESGTHFVGLSEANVIRYQQPMNFSMMFPFLGKNETKQIKIDWGIEIPKLKAGRLYFLSPTLLY